MADDWKRKMVDRWADALRTGDVVNFVPGRQKGIAGTIRNVEVDWPRLADVLCPEDKAG